MFFIFQAVFHGHLAIYGERWLTFRVAARFYTRCKLLKGKSGKTSKWKLTLMVFAYIILCEAAKASQFPGEGTVLFCRFFVLSSKPITISKGMEFESLCRTNILSKYWKTSRSAMATSRNSSRLSLHLLVLSFLRYFLLQLYKLSQMISSFQKVNHMLVNYVKNSYLLLNLVL